VNIQHLAVQARHHATALQADIQNAVTRNEHIRLSILASEADRLATAIEELASQSVYGVDYPHA
jgi:hypothetical protein